MCIDGHFSSTCAINQNRDSRKIGYSSRVRCAFDFGKNTTNEKFFDVFTGCGSPMASRIFLDDSLAKLARLRLLLMRPLTDLDTNVPPRIININYIWRVVLRQIPFRTRKARTSIPKCLKHIPLFEFLL